MKPIVPSLLILCAIFLGLSPLGAQSGSGCNPNIPVSYTISPTSPGEIYISNASGRGWKGGDTLKIPAGTYSVIEIDTFGGDPCRDIIIINSGGLVNVTGPMRFKNDVHHVKILGNGVSGLTYGFKTPVFTFTRVNHFTMEWIECGPNPAGVGIYGKQDPYVGQPWTQYPNYTSTKITINNCYVHDVAGEGMYIGHTYPGGDPANSYLVPQRLDSVTISNCIVDNTGWDGIQLSNARDGCQIFGNTVTNFGLTDIDGQRAGIISGGNTNSKVYNNMVSTGKGNGIQFFGYGTLECYNNTVSNVGNTTHNVKGEESIFGVAYVNSVESNPPQAMVIHDNQINYPKSLGAIRFWDNANSLLPVLSDNKFCFVTPPPPGWQSLYIFLQTGYTNVNNVLFCNTYSLPVVWAAFSGYRENNVNRLYWETATEINNRGFEVQRSADGIHYELLAFVHSKAMGGNSSSSLQYEYADPAVSGEIWYYRLRQLDDDNREKYSSILRIKGEKPKWLSIDAIFPNPASDHLNLMISSPTRERIFLLITDLSGKICARQPVAIDPGTNVVNVSLKGLSRGMYAVKFISSQTGSLAGLSGGKTFSVF